MSAQIHEPRRQLHADPPLIRASPQAHASAENYTIILTSQQIRNNKYEIRYRKKKRTTNFEHFQMKMQVQECYLIYRDVQSVCS